MSLPRVHIVILNWNGLDDTRRCLASVFALDYPDFRVVLCDNGSTDGSVEGLQSWAAHGHLLVSPDDENGLPEVRVERNAIAFAEYDRLLAERGGRPAADPALVFIRTGANLGFAGGNNVGLRYVLARGDAGYVWLLNNDTVVAPSALRKLVERARSDDGCAAVGATLFELTSPDRVQEMGGGTVSLWHGMVLAAGRNVLASEPRSPALTLDYITCGSALVRCSALAEVGLLDERFFLYAEDVDWGIRMRAAGYRLLYAPDAHVWHKGGASSGRRSPGNDYHNVRGALLLTEKHHPSRLPVAALYSFWRCFLPKLPRREWKRLAAVARCYRDVARHLVASRATVWQRADSSNGVTPSAAEQGSPMAGRT